VAGPVVSESKLDHGQGELLKPYVPRLLIEWMHEAPDQAYHARDGSLAFVDISGFTALTERLAGRGKIGSEVLRDTLDGVFRALLDEAYRWGAGLLKWGGDALLLLFDGPGHADRAARAAWQMQRTMDTVGRVRVGSGTVTLRMSVGVGTGTIEFFTAGSVHRELLIAGRTATETVSMEAIADAGEIALSPALAALLDAACVGVQKDEAYLLSAAPEAIPGRSPDVGDVEAATVAACIPAAAREHVLVEHSEPEHRMITACFFDLMRTDELLAELGPSAFADALDERIRTIQEAASRYEVPFNATDVAKGSVKVLLSAGAPSTTGHDEERTLRLVRDVMDTPGTIPMRAGIASGRVFTGDFGPPYRRTYVVLGDAINTAARVMARAGAGEALATQEVLERSRTTFATTAIEPFRAKGKADAVHASLLGSVTGTRAERIADTPFVGRERERAALGAILADVVAGRGWTIEIGGPSGIGKSRLVHELLAAAPPEMRVLRSMCEEYESSTPYYPLRRPVRDIIGLPPGASAVESERRLREAVAEADPTLAPWVPLLGILLGLDLPATAETGSLDQRFLREIIADTTARFLAAALRGSPFTLVVEDAQFIDDASADLLHRLSREARSSPWAVIVTRTGTGTGELRAGVDEDVRSLALELLPLADRDAVRLVELATDADPLRPHEIEELARRAGGSPLFLLELLEVARSTGGTTLPDSVEAVVAADIDRLAPSDRIVLRYASVAGVTFDESLLTRALQAEAGLDKHVWDRLRGLVDRDAGGRLRFRNSLVRDVAYEGLPFRRRRELHERVAKAIVASGSSIEDQAATLALHFSAAARHEETWRYARLAGDRAHAVAANVEAARLYELALSAAGRVRGLTGRDRADVLVSLGKARETAGLFDESFDAFRRAMRLLPDDPVERARIFALRTRARVRTGPWTRVLRETTAGLRLVEGREGEPAAAARSILRAMRAQILMFEGRAREAVPLALAAADEARRTGELEALARAYAALDGSYQLLGEPEKAVHERMALEIYTELGDLNARGLVQINLGVQSYADGRWSDALDLYTRAQDDCLRSGDRQNAAVAATNLGELLVSKGEIEEAARVLLEARRVLRSSRYTSFVVFADIQLARCALARGDVVVALEELERVVAESKGIGYAGTLLEAAAYLGHAHARAGSPQTGLATLDGAMAAAGAEAISQTAAIERARAACFAALGRRADAGECLDRALEAAKSQGLPYDELLIRRDRAALAGPGVDVAEELREAEGLAQLLEIAQ
jgi:class 3 adenylate cyclase/tetratricopeptide (TPR) repeat protein